MQTPFTGSRATLVAVASIAALAVGLVLSTGPAAQATQEFPSNPSATATAGCVDTPHFDVHLANTGGASTASFVITITREGPPQIVDVIHEDVDPNGSFDVSYAVPEDEHFDLVISSLGMSDVTASSDFDCQQPEATITFACAADGPEVQFDLASNGPSPVYFTLKVDDASIAVVPITDADGTVHLVHSIDEDAPFTAAVFDAVQDGPLASLAGTADCAPAATTTPAPAAEAVAVATAPQFTG